MKAILILEMPKNCAECKIINFMCSAVDWEERPTWCPLRPIPKKAKRNVMKGTACEEFQSLYDEGWNDCIEEIENAGQKDQ